MRLTCHDFLVQSIGPTIERIAASPNFPGRVLTCVDTRNELELARITKLVVACSEDLYGKLQYEDHGRIKADGTAARECLPEYVSRSEFDDVAVLTIIVLCKAASGHWYGLSSDIIHTRQSKYTRPLQ